MLMKSDLRKLKNCRFFSMVQLLVVITLVFKGIKNRDFFLMIISMTTKSWTIEKNQQFLCFHKSNFMSI